MSIDAKPSPPPVARSATWSMSPGLRLALVGLVAVVVVVTFLVGGVEGNWDFVLPFRGRKIATMVLVAAAIGISTVLFQTITENRILTPSIMGFDALYLLIQTLVVFLLGATALATIDPLVSWVVQVGVLVVFATLLFRWIFNGLGRSIHVLVLVGIVFGVLFSSLTAFMQRMIDPAEFAVLQGVLFASFNTVDERLLALAAVVVVVVTAAVVPLTRRLDVLVLGRDRAIALGVEHRRLVTTVLILITVLVSVSTALVGPVTFFGLIVANLAYHLVGSHRHAHTVPAAALLGIVCLVGGQLLLERVLGYATVLSVVIEFAGGILFIVLLVGKGKR